MPTTSNFGWTTPADTDLVKDGAAAIRTLGNGIDTSLVDLKGGTTGQILSKTSNTDLDYTWVTPNVGDLTEVQAGTGISVADGTGPIPIVTNTVATTFDAKGDLVVGTGADTFAKLTVGANGSTLVANSSTSTGLEWQAPASGGWTNFTPTWSGLTVGNGTVTAQYMEINKTVFIFVNVDFGSTTSISGDVLMSIPIDMETPLTGVRMGTAICYDATSSSILAVIQANTASQIRFRYLLDTGTNPIRDNDLGASGPFTWTTGDKLIAEFWYRKDV